MKHQGLELKKCSKYALQLYFTVTSRFIHTNVSSVSFGQTRGRMIDDRLRRELRSHRFLFNVGLSGPLFGFFSFFLVQRQVITGNRKEEGRISQLFRQSPTPSEIDGNSEPKEPNYVLGFEPGILGQNAIFLPLAPWLLNS